MAPRHGKIRHDAFEIVIAADEFLTRRFHARRKIDELEFGGSRLLFPAAALQRGSDQFLLQPGYILDRGCFCLLKRLQLAQGRIAFRLQRAQFLAREFLRRCCYEQATQ